MQSETLETWELINRKNKDLLGNLKEQVKTVTSIEVGLTSLNEQTRGADVERWILSLEEFYLQESFQLQDLLT